MKAYVFPGQGSQFAGMGLDDNTLSGIAAEVYKKADEILGFGLSEVMFNGTEEDLQETRITQPAIFLHSYARVKMLGAGFRPDALAGHSLGEFTALTAAQALSFENALLLVKERAEAMQASCEEQEGTMAAVVGLDDEVVEKICAGITEVVVPANYNSPGQLVISGSVEGIQKAIEQLTAAGAKKVIPLVVGGAFHSPLMQSARERLSKAIRAIEFRSPVCAIYQNVTASPSTDPEVIKQNLIDQLTAPVRWTQTMQNMIRDRITQFVEVGGKGRILCGLLRRINREVEADWI
ncbi:MAG TPA: ACP S-malonyltransferase [Saprospiraceae bacterium]|nr:ACP S-malonyltransferase [Saprospiraceae bacterium]